MEIKDLVTSMTKINQAMRKSDGPMSKKERTMAKTIKIGEEAGELDQAVLGSLNLQMKRENRKIAEVEKEIIDVIMASLSLALHLNIDVEKSIKNRLKELKQRFGVD